MYVKNKRIQKVEMCEKKNIKKTKRFRDNKRLTEREAFIYPVGIKSAQSVN